MKPACKLTALLLFVIQLNSLVSSLPNSPDPPSGCDAISDEGRCFSYFTHTGINWNDARRQCLEWGGDLATFTSPEEYALMHGTITQGKYCYIGFNDIDNEGTWVWADGDTSTYTNWLPGEPNNNYGVGAQNCGWTWYNGLVDDVWCTYEASCYFCSKIVSPFGEQTQYAIPSTLGNNSFLNRDTILYCLTEKGTEVTWSYEDIDGYSTVFPATTDARTGVSTLPVINNQIGYYRCEVSQNGGDTRTYTAMMLPPRPDPPMDCDAISYGGRCYSYFTHTGINWHDARRQCLAWGGDLATFTSQEEYSLMYSTITGGEHCYIGSNDIDNEGTWSWVDGDTSTYTNNYGVGPQNCGWTWYNGLVDDVWCTHEASCYFCSRIETSSQAIMNLRAETASKTSMRLEWSLSRTYSYDSRGQFSVFLTTPEHDSLFGITKDHSYLIHGLELGAQYTVRVELQYPFSSFTASASVSHLIAL